MLDQPLEARMMIEFVGLGGAGHDHGAAGLHGGEDAGAARRQPFVKRITEGVDLSKQSEYLGAGVHIARDEDIVRKLELAHPCLKIFLDVIEGLDEGADIGGERVASAFPENSRDIEKR